jgi:hypothetical protein
MAKRKTTRPSRVRRARPLLLVAAGVGLVGLEGCQHIIGNPGCPPAQCEFQRDQSVTPEPDLAQNVDGGRTVP